MVLYEPSYNNMVRMNDGNLRRRVPTKKSVVQHYLMFLYGVLLFFRCRNTFPYAVFYDRMVYVMYTRMNDMSRKM